MTARRAALIVFVSGGLYALFLTAYGHITGAGLPELLLLRDLPRRRKVDLLRFQR